VLKRTLLIVCGAAAIAPLAACGGSSNSEAQPDQDPGLFMAALIREKATGQYELAWKSLNPLHQRVASRTDYIQCENQTVFPGVLKRVEVIGVKDDPVVIAGETDSVAAKAVTLRVSVNSPGIRKPVVVTDTYHAVPVHGRWTWLLTRENFAEYKAGRCPGAPPRTPKV
jgi:hypothetical protein